MTMCISSWEFLVYNIIIKKIEKKAFNRNLSKLTKKIKKKSFNLLKRYCKKKYTEEEKETTPNISVLLKIVCCWKGVSCMVLRENIISIPRKGLFFIQIFAVLFKLAPYLRKYVYFSGIAWILDGLKRKKNLYFCTHFPQKAFLFELCLGNSRNIKI